MNCRFNWYINMKAKIERYNYKNKETITEIYELEDTPKIHNALKKLFAMKVWDWFIIAVTIYDNPYIPFPVVYKKFGVNGWEAHYIAVIIDNTEVILHEPLRK